MCCCVVSTPSLGILIKGEEARGAWYCRLSPAYDTWCTYARYVLSIKLPNREARLQQKNCVSVSLWKTGERARGGGGHPECCFVARGREIFSLFFLVYGHILDHAVIPAPNYNLLKNLRAAHTATAESEVRALHLPVLDGGHASSRSFACGVRANTDANVAKYSVLPIAF